MKKTLYAYFDDTGTDAQSDVVAMAGLFGTKSQWANFTNMWKTQLANPLPGKPPLRRFHMTDCEASQGEFWSYKPNDRLAVIYSFRQAILANNLYGCAMAASRRDWDALVVDPAIIRAIGDAELFCFADCVSQAGKTPGMDPDEYQVAVVFDDRPHRTAANRQVFSQYQNSNRKPNLVGLDFMSSYEACQLQGADMWAWEVRNHATDWLRTKGQASLRPHFQRFADTGRFECSVADKKSIETFVEIIRGELAKA